MSVQALFGFLSLFAALCTIFALIVTAAERWREHTQSSWPAASASIQRCALDTYVRVRGGVRSTRSRITCDIQYAANGEDVQALLHSASSSSDKDISRMQRWVSEHRTGRLIEIHYDSSNSKNAVLTKTDMPGEPFFPRRILYYFNVHLRLHVKPSFVLDVSAHIEEKMQALACYRSQFVEGRASFLDELRAGFEALRFDIDFEVERSGHLTQFVPLWAPALAWARMR